MDSGLGPTLTLIAAGILWLVYLAPSLRDRAETRSVERNVRRIAATTQDLGIRPLNPISQMSTREIVEQRRELERLARVTERRTHRRERDAVFAAAPKIAARHRRRKLALSLTILVSVGGAVVAGYFSAWAYLVLAVGFGLLGIVGLIAVNTAEISLERPARQSPRTEKPVVVDDTWTPVRTPPAHSSIPEGAGLIVTPETEKAIAARERAARIREQAARATQPGVAADPRFTEPVIETETETTGTFDINAALRARRAN